MKHFPSSTTMHTACLSILTHILYTMNIIGLVAISMVAVVYSSGVQPFTVHMWSAYASLTFFIVLVGGMGAQLLEPAKQFFVEECMTRETHNPTLLTPMDLVNAQLLVSTALAVLLAVATICYTTTHVPRSRRPPVWMAATVYVFTMCWFLGTWGGQKVFNLEAGGLKCMCYDPGLPTFVPSHDVCQSPYRR